jgi:hypothetical protein
VKQISVALAWAIANKLDHDPRFVLSETPSGSTFKYSRISDGKDVMIAAAGMHFAALFDGAEGVEPVVSTVQQFIEP